MSKNPVVHFEMGYKDRDRMIKFYETVFGWDMQSYGPEMGNYVVVTTAEAGEDPLVEGVAYLINVFDRLGTLAAKVAGPLSWQRFDL